MLYTSRKPISRKKYVSKRKAATRKPHPEGFEVLRDTGNGSEYEARTWEMAKRQGYACALCGKAFTEHRRPTFEHQDGRTKNRRDDRVIVDGRWKNAAAHGECNCRKGSKRYAWNEEQTEYQEVKR